MNEWISVEDRLPSSKEKMVLVYGKYTNDRKYLVRPAFRIRVKGKGVIWHAYQWRDFKEVTHWMPLPNPPKDK